MSQALFISREDLLKYTFLSGNLDDDKVLQFVKLAQDLNIVPLLGTDLYNKINSDIVAGTLVSPYSTLVSSYIKPILIHWSICHFLPFASYNASNKGINKPTSENSETVTKEEVDSLSAKHRSFAESYSKKFIDYMAFNYGQFPEWLTNTNEDQSPTNNIGNFSGWVM
jgi:hypothetical protein